MYFHPLGHLIFILVITFYVVKFKDIYKITKVKVIFLHIMLYLIVLIGLSSSSPWGFGMLPLPTRIVQLITPYLILSVITEIILRINRYF